MSIKVRGRFKSSSPFTIDGDWDKDQTLADVLDALSLPKETFVCVVGEAPQTPEAPLGNFLTMGRDLEVNVKFQKRNSGETLSTTNVILPPDYADHLGEIALWTRKDGSMSYVLLVDPSDAPSVWREKWANLQQKQQPSKKDCKKRLVHVYGNDTQPYCLVNRKSLKMLTFEQVRTYLQDKAFWMRSLLEMQLDLSQTPTQRRARVQDSTRNNKNKTLSSLLLPWNPLQQQPQQQKPTVGSSNKQICGFKRRCSENLPPHSMSNKRCVVKESSELKQEEEDLPEELPTRHDDSSIDDFRGTQRPSMVHSCHHHHHHHNRPIKVQDDLSDCEMI